MLLYFTIESLTYGMHIDYIDYIVTARSVFCFKRYLLNYANNIGNDFFTCRYYWHCMVCVLCF